MSSSSSQPEKAQPPANMSEMDHRKDSAWIVSFGAAMIPFTSFCYMHSRGGTGRIVEAVVKSPVGVYGLLALPFVSLAMEKCIYDTAQAAQGIDPNIRPANRGGFPSGGAALPSFSLVPVQKELPSWFSNKTTLSSRTTTTSSMSNNDNHPTVANLLRKATAEQS